MSQRHPGMAVALRCLFVATAILFLEGCSDLRDRGLEGRGAGDFPPSEGGTHFHPEGWADPASHGVGVVPFESAACLECHSIDSGKDESLPTCFSCHPLFPHEEGWVRKENHGEEVRTNGLGACATQCHGTDLQGGFSGVSCRTCHVDYPHPDDAIWIPYDTGHGKRVQSGYSGDTAACQMCHGSDLRSALDGKDCYSCHGSYPHDKMPSLPWENYEGHGVYTLDNTKTECQLCHGSDYLGGSRGNPSCKQGGCHESYPHDDPNWVVPTDPVHGSYVLTTLGNDKTPCQLCHGTDFQGGHSEKPCFTCHVDYPHVPGWDHGINAIAATGHIAECKKCHGTALNEAPAGYASCLDCHESYARHANADAGYTGWGTDGADRHGTNYILDASHRFIPNTAPYATTQTRTAECRLCHGDGDQEFKGGISSRGCMDIGLGCHTTDKSPPGPSSNDNWPMMSFACGVCHSHGSIFPTNPTCLACHSGVAAGHHGWGGITSCRTSGCHDNIMP